MVEIPPAIDPHYNSLAKRHPKEVSRWEGLQNSVLL